MPQSTADNPTVTVDQLQQLIDLVRRGMAAGVPIVDYGVAHGGLGHVPPPRHTRLVQRGGVIEHYDRDFVVRAAAGVAMGQLQATLRETNQFVPLDADTDVTLGEVVGHNVYGPLRVGYGAARDLLLGLRYVDGQGRDIHVGGRTVKNVAGYDVTRFMVGSLGELGLVYEVTLRTSAIPEVGVAVELRVDSLASLDRVMTDLLLGDASPAWVGVHWGGGERVVRLGYFGLPSGCDAQRRALEGFVDRVAGIAFCEWRACSLDQYFDEQAVVRRWRREATALVKLIVPPAVTGAVCEAIRDAWPGDYSPVMIDALPMHGCVFAGGRFDAPVAAKLDQITGALAAEHGGLCVWHARPEGCESIEPFGPVQSDWALLGKIKQAMDPYGLFNPGRFLRGEGVTR